MTDEDEWSTDVAKAKEDAKQALMHSSDDNRGLDAATAQTWVDDAVLALRKRNIVSPAAVRTIYLPWLRIPCSAPWCWKLGCVFPVATQHSSHESLHALQRITRTDTHAYID
jgi:hypothetical protein